jgi:N-acyl-D-amino-acid deacylase
MFDFLITNGEIVDGTNSPKYRGDIAIDGDRILEIGKFEATSAETVIDAQGCVVCPGFIDMHSHADMLLPIAPRAESLLHQGITTAVFGQCGQSPVPINDLNRKIILEGINSLLPCDMPNIWDEFSSFGSFLDYLERIKTPLNVIPLVGQGTIRSAIMGCRDNRPTEEEIEQIKRLIDDALDSGAFGVSTGLIYAPGSFSSTEELIETLTPMGKRGGIYFSHVRGEAGTLIQAVQEAIEIGRKTGASVEISHFKAVSPENWDKAPRALEIIEHARAEGLDVTADMYPYIAGSTGLVSMLPSQLLDGGKSTFLKKICEPLTRAKIIAKLKTGGGEITETIEWNKIMISSARNAPQYIGHMVSELAAQEGKDPYEWVLDTLLKTDGDAGMFDFIFSEDNVCMQMQHPAMMFGTDGFGLSNEGPLSNGMPHPRSFGAFPRIMGHYVRDKKVISLEEACWKSSGFPAQKMGLTDRGVIRKGCKADLVILEPDTIIDRATFLQPHQYPAGIRYVMVNGKIVICRGIQTDSRPGVVIRRRW